MSRAAGRQGASVVPQHITDASAQHVNTAGNQVIATVAVGIPEPASMMLLGAGLLGLVVLGRTRKPG